jgi:CHASE2 domain-containing sensor protein
MFTRKPSARRRRRGAVIAAIALGSVIATWLLGYVRFFQLVHLKAGDLHFLVRGNKPTSNIVILAIDQKTLDNFHELREFWHPYYAEAINAAAEGGAKVLMMDIVFGVDVRKYEPDHDQLLAAAILANVDKMPVVCANIASMNGKARDWAVQLNMAASAYNLNAFPNLTADPDDFIRSQELIESRMRKENSPEGSPSASPRSFAEWMEKSRWTAQMGGSDDSPNDCDQLCGSAGNVSIHFTFRFHRGGPRR